MKKRIVIVLLAGTALIGTTLLFQPAASQPQPEEEAEDQVKVVTTQDSPTTYQIGAYDLQTGETLGRNSGPGSVVSIVRNDSDTVIVTSQTFLAGTFEYGTGEEVVFEHASGRIVRTPEGEVRWAGSDPNTPEWWINEMLMRAAADYAPNCGDGRGCITHILAFEVPSMHEQSRIQQQGWHSGNIELP
jgi:hypothetical protein